MVLSFPQALSMTLVHLRSRVHGQMMIRKKFSMIRRQKTCCKKNWTWMSSSHYYKKHFKPRDVKCIVPLLNLRHSLHDCVSDIDLTHFFDSNTTQTISMLECIYDTSLTHFYNFNMT